MMYNSDNPKNTGQYNLRTDHQPTITFVSDIYVYPTMLIGKSLLISLSSTNKGRSQPLTWQPGFPLVEKEEPNPAWIHGQSWIPYTKNAWLMPFISASFQCSLHQMSKMP